MFATALGCRVMLNLGSGSHGFSISFPQIQGLWRCDWLRIEPHQHGYVLLGAPPQRCLRLIGASQNDFDNFLDGKLAIPHQPHPTRPARSM